MKTPVIKKKDYIVYFENHEGYTFIHCDCHRWSKTIRQNLIKDIDVLTKLHGASIYCTHDKEDKKHFKFITMLQFSYVMDIMCTDGKERQIFERKV